jgi:hypothetical protein
MTRTEQDLSPGRIQSQPYHAGSDTVLPDKVRAQLRVPPKRPRILGPPKPTAPREPAKGRPFLTVYSTLLIVSVITTLLRQRVPLEPSLQRAPQPTPGAITVVPTPGAVSPIPPPPKPTAVPTLEARVPEIPPLTLVPNSPAPTPEVRRAKPVRLPDPRLPEQQRILERAREARARDLHALNRELREVLRRVESGPPST